MDEEAKSIPPKVFLSLGFGLPETSFSCFYVYAWFGNWQSDTDFIAVIIQPGILCQLHDELEQEMLFIF